jgi:nucleoside-diphosphate-sugar epimerase
MRLFITGGSGVIGRAFLPQAKAAGHLFTAPGRDDLDLFDQPAVTAAVSGADAVIHLATRIMPLHDLSKPQAWQENDRLRSEAAHVLVTAGLQAGAAAYLQPTVTFVYPPDIQVSEQTPVSNVPDILRSALDAERETARFAAAGRRGVALRLGLLDGPGTGHDTPVPTFGATLHVEDAARALLAALTAPSGIYNVCRDGERVSNYRFRRQTGWRPLR